MNKFINKCKVFIVLFFCIMVIFSGQISVLAEEIIQNEAFLQIYPCNNSILKNPYISTAIDVNDSSKVFNKNLKNYKRFIIDNTNIPTDFYARFILPEIADDLDFKRNKTEKNEIIRQIVDNLYLNILKNDKMMLIQKEQITIKKEMLDNEKLQGDLKNIMIKNTEYIEAQNEYLEYKKAYASCIKQLEIWIEQPYEQSKTLDDFDSQIFYDAKFNEYAKNNEKNKLFELKQKYVALQNSTKKLENYLPDANSLDKKDNACDLKKHKILSETVFLNSCI